MRLWSDGANSYIESNGDENGMVFRSNGGNKVSLMSNVGIGTTDTKGFKFAVAGPMVAESVKVQLKDQWVYSDYVFKLFYKLPALQEVENYIKENQHLPDIPSEKEVKDKGMELGEMNAKLLKKIEEMTLYILEINKQVKFQLQEINDLKKHISNK